MLNPFKIKQDFPIFQNNPTLVYLDSSATSLKPNSVINKLSEYYEKYCANVYRGIYKISEKATEEYEETRHVVAAFINANKSEEIIFTRGTTESLNLVAYSLGRQIIQKGDEIVTTIMEHHSNFVPWQQLAMENGADLKIIDTNEWGFLNLDLRHLDKVISNKTKIFALTYVSNVLGTINSLKEIIKATKKINPKIVIVVDAAQAAPHMKIDVRELGCDFLAFSSHKMLGPTGVGVLWGKYELFDSMFPFQFGGEMITEVYLDRTVYKKPPHKFEAGTPHISGVIALKAAIDYLQSLGWETIRKHEVALTTLAIGKMNNAFGKKIRIFGPNEISHKAGIITFKFHKYHPHDIAQILDEENIAIRAGHHCAMPLHTRLGFVATSRVSLYIYNTEEDIKKLIGGLRKVEKILG